MDLINHIRTRSISVLLYHAGGCGGCSCQFFEALSQHTDIKGVSMTGNPKHADVFLITGCINEKSKKTILRLYEQVPSPKSVIAAGACACEGSLFRGDDNGVYPLEKIIPVDAWVRGCPPGLNEIIETVVRVIESSCEEDEGRRQHDKELE